MENISDSERPRSFFSLKEDDISDFSDDYNICIISDFSSSNSSSDPFKPCIPSSHDSIDCWDRFFCKGSDKPFFVSENYDAFILNGLCEEEKHSFYNYVKKMLDGCSLFRVSAFVEVNGHPLFVLPCGPDDVVSDEDLFLCISKTAQMISAFGAAPKIGLLSGGRAGDLGRSPVVDATIYRSEALEKKLKSRGYDVHNHTILIEEAIGISNIIVAPDSLSGELIVRTICGVGVGYEIGTFLFSDSERIPLIAECLTPSCNLNFLKAFIIKTLNREKEQRHAKQQ